MILPKLNLTKLKLEYLKSDFKQQKKDVNTDEKFLYHSSSTIFSSASSLFGPIISSNAEYCCWKPVHRVIIESRKLSVPFGGWYRRQEASMRSAVCSSVPQLQFRSSLFFEYGCKIVMLQQLTV